MNRHAMPAATAPGKIILFGEHAVVYGRPAIAAPVSQVQARAVVSAEPRRPSGEVHLQAPDIGLEADLADLPDEHPLALAVQWLLAGTGLERAPACTLRITSTIPVAAGMGSGAAVSVAMIRALFGFLGRPLPDERVSALAYEVEKLHHGTPSGIDNTVITYAMPVYFVRGQPMQTLRLPAPFTLVIGDTGIASPTAGGGRRCAPRLAGRPSALRGAVRRCRTRWRSVRARPSKPGSPEALGPLMDENHDLLRRWASPARSWTGWCRRRAGRGAGRQAFRRRARRQYDRPGAADEAARPVAEALHAAGAERTLITTVRPPGGAASGRRGQVMDYRRDRMSCS